ncbi:MAG: DUF5107 domain-containing protein [Prolixibacteraceae bacterium]|nr:DUF5107 domain-containing protein [Prolixibacteraceae bacterium]
MTQPSQNNASVWIEDVIIPTYKAGIPEKNPVFLEKRVYQGSSGAVYPYPVIESVSDEKTDETYTAIYLENEYLKIMILPELGGRVQMAYDKTKQRHFIYYNQVIKPALVGLTGPWISGGIEFNWPQHHRPGTFDPVDFTIEENPDGSVTAWVSELERMFRTKALAGFTLYPDKAYLEISVKLYNGTPFPQTFLWWANPAVKVNDHYQSVFPPDVNAVFDHGKRDVSEFPIAKGTYYKVDYSPGTDISRYKNIPNPTSYMAIKSKYDFVGGYENDSKGGLLHVANHHISPGKKQWTWGNCDFGQAWDRNLTDEDGPYIELMCGVYTDNQPDFSWMMPGEEKSFNQYFMPYRDLGVVKNATKEAMVNMEFDDEKVVVKAYTTACYPAGKIILQYTGEELFCETFDFHPAVSYEKKINIAPDSDISDFHVVIQSNDGKTLVEWRLEKEVSKDILEPARAAQAPGDIENNEQLYLTGLHLEQYRHATRDPRDYYSEALRRDPKDSRCNNALGLWYLRRGQFAKAENYFNVTIETLTERNPNPINGEPFYNLGLSLMFQEKYDEAYEAFYKSVWNAAWMNSGYFSIARIEAMQKKWDAALDTIQRSLIRNWHDHKARHLKTAVLRHSNRLEEARSWCEESLKIDQFNFGLYFEEYLLGNQSALEKLRKLIRGNIHNYIEYSLDYAMAGFYEEALDLLVTGIADHKKADLYPLAIYFKAWFEYKLGKEGYHATLIDAANSDPGYCFPNQPESVLVLQWASEQNKQDAKALYYLGNYWYAHKNYEAAVDVWEKSSAIDDTFPTVHRNLALAYHNKMNDTSKAVKFLQKAFELNTNDSRVLMELDQLKKIQNVSLEKRLQFLEKHLALVFQRDDLYLERITLLNQLGHYGKSLSFLNSHKFHPWEGGEGKVVGQYLIAVTGLAKECLENGKPQKAIDYLKMTENYPHNLGEGKLFGTQENDINYLKGLAFEMMGENDRAVACFVEATNGISEPVQAIFYNDPQPDKIFYKGLAWLKLDKPEKARPVFKKLIDFGNAHLNDKITIDYFAVSLPDLLVFEQDLDLKNHIHCLYMKGLGYLGLKDFHAMNYCLGRVLELDVNHQGAMIHRDFRLF